MSIAEAATADRAHVVLPIEGMTCATCVGRVEKALSALPGVQARVNLSSEQADVYFDPTRIAPAALAEAIARAGYDVPHETHELVISGMTCATCASRIEKALKTLAGVMRAEILRARRLRSTTVPPNATRSMSLRKIRSTFTRKFAACIASTEDSRSTKRSERQTAMATARLRLANLS